MQSAGGPVAFTTVVFVRRMARGAAYQSPLFARIRLSFTCNTNQGHRSMKLNRSTSVHLGGLPWRTSEVLKCVIRDRLE